MGNLELLINTAAVVMSDGERQEAGVFHRKPTEAKEEHTKIHKAPLT